MQAQPKVDALVIVTLNNKDRMNVRSMLAMRQIHSIREGYFSERQSITSSWKISNGFESGVKPDAIKYVMGHPFTKMIPYTYTHTHEESAEDKFDRIYNLLLQSDLKTASIELDKDSLLSSEGSKTIS